MTWGLPSRMSSIGASEWDGLSFACPVGQDSAAHGEDLRVASADQLAGRIEDDAALADVEALCPVFLLGEYIVEVVGAVIVAGPGLGGDRIALDAQHEGVDLDVQHDAGAEGLPVHGATTNHRSSPLPEILRLERWCQGRKAAGPSERRAVQGCSGRSTSWLA